MMIQGSRDSGRFGVAGFQCGAPLACSIAYVAVANLIFITLLYFEDDCTRIYGQGPSMYEQNWCTHMDMHDYVNSSKEDANHLSIQSFTHK